MKQEPIYDEFLEKRKARQRKAKKKRAIISFIFLSLVLVITAVILCLTVFFPINSISASGSNIYTADEIIAQSGIKAGDNIFTFGEKQATANLKKNLPFIEKVDFVRNLPDGLLIKVSDAKAYFCYKQGESYYNVSKSGWVLERVSEKSEDVFEVKLSGAECKVGEMIALKDENSREILENLITLLEENSFKVDSVDVTNVISLKAEIEGRFTVNFGTENDLESKVRHLKKTCDTLGNDVSGSINLSVWNDQKPEAYFVKNNTN